MDDWGYPQDHKNHLKWGSDVASSMDPGSGMEVETPARGRFLRQNSKP